MTLRERAGLLVLLLACALGQAAAAQSSNCARLVSLAPSLTEIVFGLGLGPQLVGDTEFCHYPEAAREKPKVGGLFNLSIEAVVALRPDLILSLSEYGERTRQLEQLGLKVKTFDQRSLQGIRSSIESIGALCGVEQQAAQMVAALDSKISATRARVANLKPVSVLLVVGDAGAGLGLRGVYVSGNDGFYNELLEIAGGVNVFRGKTSSVAGISSESVLQRDPQVIIQVAPSSGVESVTDGELQKTWGALSGLRAVQQKRVYLLKGDYVVIPGPRLGLILDRLVKILHPEVAE